MYEMSRLTQKRYYYETVKKAWIQSILHDWWHSLFNLKLLISHQIKKKARTVVHEVWHCICLGVELYFPLSNKKSLLALISNISIFCQRYVTTLFSGKWNDGDCHRHDRFGMMVNKPWLPWIDQNGDRWFIQPEWHEISLLLGWFAFNIKLGGQVAEGNPGTSECP